MSATMLETYDTQMLDYPSDIDVPMHSSSSDAWFHGEATMEDVPHAHMHPHRPTTESPDISVEVDMESYEDGGTAEYEMADDLQIVDVDTLPHDGSDVLDVDVYDASLAHSPATAVHEVDSLSAQPGSEVVDGVFSGLVDAPEGLSLPTLDLNPSHILPFNHTETEAPLELDASADSASLLDAGEEPSASSPAVASVPLREVETISSGEGVHDHDAGIAVASSSEQAVQPQGSEYSEEVPPGAESHLDAPSTAQESTTEILRAENNTATDAESHSRTEQQDEAGTDDEGDFGSSTSAGNPHEISEGVYIDPPPPVLLSLSDQAELSLFNEPTVPGSTSPPSNESQERHTAHVLLQNHPILYYEPLSSVFEALREDDYISSISEYSDGELVLEAYDLQLVVSEDNIYARDVSLHDLNVLHDGLGISGPLRIRLQTVIPRFVVRYHMLQEQVARLNLGQHGQVFPATNPEVEHVHNEETNQNEHRDQSKTEGQVNEGRSQAPDHAPGHPSDNDEHTAIAETEQERPDTPTGEHTVELEETENDEDGARSIDDQKPDSINLPTESNVEGLDAADLASVHEPEDEVDYEEEYDHDHAETKLIIDIPGDVEEHVPLRTSPEAASTVDTPRQNDSHLSPESYDKRASGSGNSDVVAAQGVLKADDIHEDRSTEQDSAAASQDVDSQTSVDSSDAVQQEVAEHPDPSSSGIGGLEAGSAEYGQEEEWDDDLDGEGDLDTTWEAENEADAISNESSITLSSKASKRSYDEVEFGLDDDGGSTSPSSPGKRPRVE